MINLGMVQYINALPFHLNLKKDGLKLTFDVPANLNRKLREDSLDVSLISAGEFVQGGLKPFSHFGIFAKDEILSVNLYVKIGLKSLERALLGLTSESLTSQMALKIICHFFWKVSPRFLPLKEPFSVYDAFLLIGDAALNRLEVEGFERIDIAAVWKSFTSLPLVFALFASKGDAPSYLEERLESALSFAEQNKEEVITAAQKKMDLPYPLLSKYFDLCHYRLGTREMRSLNLFKELSLGLPKSQS